MISQGLRFCMVTTFYPPYNFGGDGIFVHRLSNELAALGHKVEVIHCIDSYRLLAGAKLKEPYDDHANVTVHGLRSHFGLLSPLATQQSGYPLFKSARLKQILSKRFDVIHYHNISLVGGPKILAYGRGIKLYTMHEYWLVCPMHLMYKFNRSVCTKQNCFLCSLVHKRPPQWWRYSRLLKFATNHVDAFIAPSRFCLKLHQQMGLKVKSVHLPNFIPSDGTQSKTFTERHIKVPLKPYFLFVGRLEKIKGLQTLIPLFFSYKKAQLLIAGRGKHEPYLHDLSRNYGNVKFLGHLSYHQLQPLYQRATAVVIPSLWYENLPLVIIEAAKDRTPVIVRKLGALPETIRESQGGIIYDTNSELLAAMDYLLANPGYRKELGERAYDTYQRQWSTEAHLNRYFSLIRRLKEARNGNHSTNTV